MRDSIELTPPSGEAFAAAEQSRHASVSAPVHRVASSGFWDALAPRWHSDTEETLICAQVRQETHDVKTFVFHAPTARTFVYEPGQFITLELEIDGQALNRCYTISSSPTRPHTLAITVKRVPGGAVSNWLHDHLRRGDSVRALGPAGAFTSARHPAEKYLFLSAGSGVTPLMSMSRAYHDLAEDRDIVFVHSARTPDDIVFEHEVAAIAAAQTQFRSAFVCERRGARAAWSGVTGYLTLPLLTVIAPDYLEREIFVCGPAPYMKAVRELLSVAGFDSRHYHEESFSFETIVDVAAQLATAHVGAALAPADQNLLADPGNSTEPVELPHATFGFLEHDGITSPPTDAVPTQYTVRFEKSRRDIVCASDQLVLDAAKKAGVRMPSSCRQGMCGTCKVKLLSGEVDMQHAGGIRQREIDQGMVLLCCSKPKSDLLLDK
ncbi:hybrid-cluster NAD(P)-dependent oxidoreductase [Robbsia sp. KACC 23696]|uniref:hybrid-cluster NAD(P)-dependent oxidoreductase n=1 Tax=Robbsia sp. KACC 23696 TaxID=3149231 RepID=UPI00325AE573